MEDRFESELCDMLEAHEKEELLKKWIMKEYKKRGKKCIKTKKS